MRLLSLFLIVSIMVCYSGGVCSASVLVADETEQTGSHCEMMNHSQSDKSVESQMLIQSAKSTDSSNSSCCYEALTSSSPIKESTNYMNPKVLYVLELPTSIFYKVSRSTDQTFAGSAHDPPDIYLSVSRFLL